MFHRIVRDFMVKNIYCIKCGEKIKSGKYFSSYFCEQCGNEIMKHRGGNGMIVLGIIIILFGGGLWIYGDNMNNDMNTVMDSFFNSGKTNPGSSLVNIGIVVMIVGAILVLCGIINIIIANNRSKPTYDIPKIICPFCKSATSSSSSFCTKCGKFFEEMHNDFAISTIKCGNCGTENEINSSFCKNCGNKFR